MNCVACVYFLSCPSHEHLSRCLVLKCLLFLSYIDVFDDLELDDRKNRAPLFLVGAEQSCLTQFP